MLRVPRRVEIKEGRWSGAVRAPRVSKIQWFWNEEECEHVAKSYIKNSLNVDIEESVFNRIHRIGPKINKNGKTFQQIIVKFKSFVPRTKVCRARKHKADIAIHLDLTKRHYLLLKDASDKTKDGASVNFAFVDN